MPPRKKQSSLAEGGTALKPRKVGRSRTKVHKEDDKRREAEAKNRNNDDEIQSVGSQGQSSQIFNRKNRLNDLLSSSQVGIKPSGKRMASSTANSPVNRNAFEEDDGFIYKRSQSAERMDGARAGKRPRQLDMSIASLQQEIGYMSKADDDLNLADLSERIQSKPKKPRQAPRAKAGGAGSTGRGRQSKAKSETIMLSSPIKSPRYDRKTSGYSSDEYVEQVSHHKLSLMDNKFGQNGGRPSNKRRSSYHNRGKRVSSIGNGFEGEPHEDVPVSEYYKLLDTSLPEPDRMRQLLIWCFKKRLEQEDKETKLDTINTEDQTVLNIAKVIKEEIIQDLTEKQISTSWYSNFSSNEDDILTNKEIKIPNPQNISNRKNIDVYYMKLKNLVKEKADWQRTFNRAVQPVANLSVENLADNRSGLGKYLETAESQEERVPYAKDVLSEQLIVNIQQNQSEAQEKISQVEPSVDRVYHLSHQLQKAADLVHTISQNTLNPQTAALLKNYMNRNDPETFTQESKSSHTAWPRPREPFSAIELLRGISRLEHSRK